VEVAAHDKKVLAVVGGGLNVVAVIGLAIEAWPPGGSTAGSATAQETSYGPGLTDADAQSPDSSSLTTCVQAMKAAADEPNDRLASPLIVATLDACPDVGYWFNALNQFPAAMGLTDDAVIGPLRSRRSARGT
jgi:hypothetical protein